MKTINNQSTYSIASELLNMGFTCTDGKIFKEAFGYTAIEVEAIIEEMKKQ